MIFLIGGAPRSGKSILASKLSKKIDVPWISIDFLRPLILPYIKGEEKISMFPFEKMFCAGNTNKFFEKYTPKEILQTQLRESRSMWPGIKSFIKHQISCGQNYIIEGVQLLPKYIDVFKKTKHKKEIEVVYLVKKNKQELLEDFIKQPAWLRVTVRKKETLTKIAEMVQVYSKYFEREAKKYNFTLYDMDLNFQKQLTLIIKELIH